MYSRIRYIHCVVPRSSPSVSRSFSSSQKSNLLILLTPAPGSHVMPFVSVILTTLSTSVKWNHAVCLFFILFSCCYSNRVFSTTLSSKLLIRSLLYLIYRWFPLFFISVIFNFWLILFCFLSLYVCVWFIRKWTKYQGLKKERPKILSHGNLKEIFNSKA